MNLRTTLLYDTWNEGEFTHTANLRTEEGNSIVSGTFLQHTQTGIRPITAMSGDIAGIGIQYEDGGIQVSLCYVRYWGGDVDVGSYDQQTGEYEINVNSTGIFRIFYNVLTPYGWTYVVGPTFSLSLGEEYEMDVVVVEMRSRELIVTVQDSSGVPVSDCYVRVFHEFTWEDSDSWQKSEVWQTDSNGEVAVHALYGNQIISASRTDSELITPEDGEVYQSLMMDEDSESIIVTLPD